MQVFSGSSGESESKFVNPVVSIGVFVVCSYAFSHSGVYFLPSISVNFSKDLNTRKQDTGPVCFSDPTVYLKCW